MISVTLRHRRRRIGIGPGEVLDSVETDRDGTRAYYSYTYRVYRAGYWMPQVRWDNASGQPHVETYDGRGGLTGDGPTTERRLDDVIRLVQTFRRGLLDLPLAEL